MPEGYLPIQHRTQERIVARTHFRVDRHQQFSIQSAKFAAGTKYYAERKHPVQATGRCADEPRLGHHPPRIDDIDASLAFVQLLQSRDFRLCHHF